MAETTTLDLQNGASRTKGYQDRRTDSAVRPFVVTGLTPGTDALDDAIDLAAAAAGITHHIDGTLERFAITARHLSGTKAIGEIRYARGQASTPTRTSDELTSRHSGFSSFPWYRNFNSTDADGRPNGPLTLTPLAPGQTYASRRPMAWSWRFGVTTFVIPTVLNSCPNQGYFDLVGTINSNPTAQGLTTGAFPAKSIYLGGIRATPLDTPLGVRWLVNYLFVYNPFKWRMMTAPYWVGDAETGDWETSLVDAHRAALFPLFPRHA